MRELRLVVLDPVVAVIMGDSHKNSETRRDRGQKGEVPDPNAEAQRFCVGGDRPSLGRQAKARKISPDDNNSRKAAVLSSLPIIGLCEWFAGHLEWILLLGANWWDQVR